MENYWRQLKEELKSGAERAAGDIREGKEFFRVEPGEKEFRLSLIHGGETVATLTVTKNERSIDLHTVLADGKKITGAFEIRNGYLSAVHTDSIYFMDAAHAAGNFLKPATDAVYYPPFNIPKR
jgi:hypothetical protein